MTARRSLLALGIAAAAALPPALSAQRVIEIQVAPAFLRILPGAQTMALATAYDGDGNPVDARIYWWSSNINVASVDSNGMIRAVAPGLAIITASTDSSAARRRRFGRTTVIVAGTGVMPDGLPGNKRMIVTSDTAVPPECTDAEFGFRNVGRVCFDSPPNLIGSPILEVPSDCPESTTPAVYLVRVDDRGQAGAFRVLSLSSCDRYQEWATMRVRSARFRPARRNGLPVAAWTVLAYRTPMTNPRIYITPPAPTPMPPVTPRIPAPNKQPPRP